jgi:hypothetical protein
MQSVHTPCQVPGDCAPAAMASPAAGTAQAQASNVACTASQCSAGVRAAHATSLTQDDNDPHHGLVSHRCLPHTLRCSQPAGAEVAEAGAAAAAGGGSGWRKRSMPAPCGQPFRLKSLRVSCKQRWGSRDFSCGIASCMAHIFIRPHCESATPPAGAACGGGPSCQVAPVAVCSEARKTRSLRSAEHRELSNMRMLVAAVRALKLCPAGARARRACCRSAVTLLMKS